MRAGKMREFVTLQSKSVSRAANGEELVTWGTYATVWAQVQPIGGREYSAIRLAQSDITHRFRIRYLSGVNTGMRVLLDGRPYDIVEAINVDQRNRELELLCVGDMGNA